MSGLRGGPTCSRFPASPMRRAFDEVDELAAAEFVAVGEFIFSDPRGPAAAVADAAARLKAETAA